MVALGRNSVVVVVAFEFPSVDYVRVRAKDLEANDTFEILVLHNLLRFYSLNVNSKGQPGSESRNNETPHRANNIPTEVHFPLGFFGVSVLARDGPEFHADTPGRKAVLGCTCR